VVEGIEDIDLIGCSNRYGNAYMRVIAVERRHERLLPCAPYVS
jgi:hypothetical protein